MSAKFLLRSTISVLGMGLALYCSEAAADDVYVDLSVLDALGTPSSPMMNSAPLFPVVSSAPQFPEVKKVSVKKKTAKKTSAKKAAPVKKEVVAPVDVEEKASVAEETLNIPVKEDVAIDIEAKEPTLTAEELSDSPFAVEQDIPVQEETSAAPIAPVEVEVEEIEENSNPTTMEPINGVTQIPTAEDDSENNNISEITSEPVSETTAEVSEQTAETSSAEVEETPVNNETSTPTEAESLFALTENTSETSEEKNAPRPLIENAPQDTDTAPTFIQPLPDNDIVFAEDSDELTDADKQKIDDIIAGFENPQVNKIAIYSYNLDTGKDSFYRKRMSLNRAVGVRSYLLNKGYKNFSIKVINIDEDDGKSNSVSIEELK